VSTPFPPPSGEPVPVPPSADVPATPPPGTLPPPASPYAPPAPPTAPAFAAPAVPQPYAPAPTAGYGEPPLGPPTYLDANVMPDAAPTPERRGRGKAVVAATLAVLLLILGAGAAYGWTVLHRPDVQLARAFSATTSAAQGDVTVNIEGGTDIAGAPTVRYAWGTNTQQIQVRSGSVTQADIILTPNHLTLTIDPSVFASQPEALAQLHTIANTLGADGAALDALANGKPVGLAIGPGSPVQKLIDSLQAASGKTSSSSPSVSTDQIAKVASALEDAVKNNVTVTSVGSDQYGDHDKVALPLKPVAQAVMSSVSSQLGPLAGKVSSADLSSLDGKTATVDVWTRDGQIARVVVPSSALGDDKNSAAIVATFGNGGVQLPTVPVTEIDGGLLDKLLGGLGSLGDLGGFGASGSGTGTGSIGG
jgi:hypothetical protein